MTDKNSGPEEGIKGVVEDVKGKAKEAVGTVTGRDDIVEEGKAQQDKAEAQRDAAKKEAEAEAARGGAKAAEKREESHQNASPRTTKVKGPSGRSAGSLHHSPSAQGLGPSVYAAALHTLGEQYLVARRSQLSW